MIFRPLVEASLIDSPYFFFIIALSYYVLKNLELKWSFPIRIAFFCQMYKPRALTVIRLKKELVYVMGFMYICVCTRHYV